MPCTWDVLHATGTSQEQHKNHTQAGAVQISSAHSSGASSTIYGVLEDAKEHCYGTISITLLHLHLPKAPITIKQHVHLSRIQCQTTHAHISLSTCGIIISHARRLGRGVKNIPRVGTGSPPQKADQAVSFHKPS